MFLVKQGVPSDEEQSVGGFLPGGGGKGAMARVNYVNPFMPRKLYLSSCDVRNLASCAQLFLQ